MATPLTVREDAPATDSTPRDAHVHQLLAMYQDVFDTVDNLPWVPMVLSKRRARLHYLPRAK
jgi:hypothetical protein